MHTLGVLVLGVSMAAAADPQFGTSTVSVGAGVALPAAGYRTRPYHTGFALSGEYELHLHKYVAATLGVDNFFMNLAHSGRFPEPDTRERVTLLPIGLRGVVPAGGGRAELFAGTGAAPYWSSDYELGHGLFKDAALWHLNGGFRVALDSGGRCRAGAAVRYYRDLGRPTMQWVSLAGELSFRLLR